MAFTLRKQATIRGAMTFTGNTLGLAKRDDQNAIGTLHSIGAFTSLNTSLVVDAYPNGMTLDYTLNSSSAYLNLPANATVVYAELIWGGTCKTASTNTLPGLNISDTVLNQPITFITPDGVSRPVTGSVTFRKAADNGVEYYMRSYDVTPIVHQYLTGNNLYTVGNVPALADPYESRSSATCFAGWTLAVIYEDISMPLRNMALSVGGEIVDGDNQNDVTIPITGFVTPYVGTVSSRILCSAGEGDSMLNGDTAIFAPTMAQLNNAHRLSGPNNPITNFFCSQINNDNGTLNTTGTFGNRNNNMSTTPATLFSGARQGWDITNVSGSSLMVNNQTSAYLRVTTDGDTYVPVALGVQINMQELNLTITKSSPQENSYAKIGDVIDYTLVVKNDDALLTATSLKVVDTLPGGLQLNAGSVSINGGPLQDIDITTQPGVQIPSLSPGQSATITFKATVVGPPSSGTIYRNTANVNYTYSPAQGVNPTDTKYSTPVDINYFVDRSVYQKSVNPAGTVPPGTILTYTLSFTNNSILPVSTVRLTDTIPLQTTLSADPQGITGAGAVFNNVAPGATVNASYSVTVNANATGAIKNSSVANYTYTNGSTGTKTSTVENFVSPVLLDITKSQSVMYVVNGDIVTYTLVVANHGTVPLSNIQIYDPIPVGLSYVANTFRVNNTLLPGVVSLNDWISLGNAYSLPTINSQLTITFNVRVDDTTILPYINTGYARADYSTNAGTKTTEAESNHVTLRTAAVPVTVTKSADRYMVSSSGSDIVTYTLNISSTGAAQTFNLTELWPTATDGTVMNYVANSITINPAIVAPDALTVNANGFTLLLNSLTSASNYTLTFQMQAPAIGNNPARIFSNSAAYDYYYPKDPTKPNELTHETGNTIPPVLVSQAPIDISFTKGISLISNGASVGAISTAFVGETIQYQFVYTNNSRETVSINAISDLYLLPNQIDVIEGSVVVVTGPPSTTIPSSNYTVTYPAESNIYELSVNFTTAPTLTLGQSLTLTVNATVLADAANFVTDYGLATFTLPGGAPQTISSQTVRLDVANPVIGLSKYASVLDAQIGDQYNYTFEVTNNGNIPLTAISLADTPLAQYILNGTLQLIGQILVDNVAVGTNFSNIPIPNMSVGDSVSITAAVRILSLTASLTIDNTSIVTGTGTITRSGIDSSLNTKTVTHSASDTVLLLQISVSIAKDADQTDVENGETVSYTVTVTNNSNVPLLNAIVQDIIPDGLSVVEGTVNPDGDLELGIDVGPLAAGESATITFDAILTSPTGSNAVISNCVFVNYTYQLNDGHTQCVTGTPVCTDTTVYVPALTVIKAPTGSNVLLGQSFTYTVTVTNTGSIPLTSFYLSDLLPTGITQTSTQIQVVKNNVTTPITADLSNPAYIDLQQSLNVGESMVIRIPVVVTSNPFTRIEPNCYTNTARIRYSYSIGTVINTRILASNASSLCIIIPNVAATKTATPTTATAGDIITYIIRIANVGTVDVTNISLTDPLPSGLEYVTDYTIVNGSIVQQTVSEGIVIPLIPANSAATVVYTARVSNISLQPYVNQGTFSYDYLLNGMTQTVTGQKTNTATVTVPNATSGSMSIVKSSIDQTVRVGDYIDFTLTVTNTGNTSLTDIVIKDSVPAGLQYVSNSVSLNGVPTTYDIGSGVPISALYPSGSVLGASSAVITFRTLAVAPLESSYPNFATGTFTAQTTSGPVAGSIVSNTLTLSSAQIAITKQVDKLSANPNDELNYTVTVSNLGSSPLANVVLSETVDSRVQVDQSSVALNGTPVSGFPTITIGNLTAANTTGDSAILTFRAVINSTASGSPITNLATSTGVTTTDSKTVTGSSSVVTNIGTETNAALSIIKSTNASTVSLCDIVTYTLTVTNTGSLPLSNVIISDQLSEGMTLIPNSTSVNGRLNGYDITAGVNIGSLDIDSDSVLITYRAQACSYASVYTNQAKGIYNFTLNGTTYSVNAISNPISLPATYRYQTRLNQISITLPRRLDVCKVLNVEMQLGTVCNSYNSLIDTTTFDFDYELIVFYVNSWNCIEQYVYSNSTYITVPGNAMGAPLKANAVFRYSQCSNTVEVLPEIMY